MGTSFHYDPAGREEDFLRQNRVPIQTPRRSSFSGGGGLRGGKGSRSTGASLTLPKPLKGILKNRTRQEEYSYHHTQNTSLLWPPLHDLVPFDNVPPCDDCVYKARILGSYTGNCSSNQECAMNTSTLRRSLGSLRSLSRNSEEKEVVETVESSV